MKIGELDYPDIEGPDEIIDDDEDDEEKIDKICNKILHYIKKNKITPKNFSKHRNARIKELRILIKDLNMLLYAEAYQQRKTYSGFIRRQDALRRGVFKSLLSGLSADGQIIVIQELLRDLEGDTEPTEFYIW